MATQRRLRTLSIHSHKGGAGKTTLALALAKAWSVAERRTCVVDLDFVGSGLEDAILLKRPRERVEPVLLYGEPAILDELVGSYSDRDIRERPIGLVLNAGRPLAANPDQAAEVEGPTRDEAAVAAGLEGMDGPIRDGLRRLLAALAEAGYERCILDCHPGLFEVSLSALQAPFVDARMLVSTTDASHFWGLFKELNWLRYRWGLETALGRSMLVVNRADPERFPDFAAVRKEALHDPRIEAEFATVADDPPVPRQLVVHEMESLRGIQTLGRSAELPTLRSPDHADVFALRDAIDDIFAARRSRRSGSGGK